MSSMRGWCSLSITRAQVLKVAGELYKLSSSEKELSLLRELDPPFILQGGTPYLHSSIASVCCLIAVVDSLPLSVGGPRSASRERWQLSWAVLLGKGPSLVGRNGLRASVGCPAVVPSLVRPYTFRASSPEWVLTGEWHAR